MRALSPATTWRYIFPIARCTVVLPVVFIIGCLWAGLYTGTALASGDNPNGSSFEMQMVYKYSQEFRELTKGRPEWEHFASQEWPPPGSPEFYHNLVVQDRHKRASRNLLGNNTDIYHLRPSNETYYIPQLGGIHYTVIALGTPRKPFVVALDTGSDLLWVPCDCQQCSSASWANYGIDLSLDFSIYSPTNSTTSKSVACNDAICKTTLSPTTCDASAPKACTYISKYISPNTSSSGTIVQDVVYLNPESRSGPNVTANVYFGCGTLQTGDFLTGGAPNGLFGLGPEVYSIPRTLASTGFTRDVFSMCFSTPSAVGRLVFGRKPAASLQSTPLIAVNPSVYYVLRLEGIVAGGVSLNVSGNVVFDTGTSLTTLPSEIIKLLGDALASKTTLETWSFSYRDTLQFSYCWNATTTADQDKLSSLSFIFGGGGNWTIADPLLGFGTDGVVQFVCLGILDSESLSAPPIIGYNFMTMHEYYFDMEASTFSWVPSDCSSSNATGTLVEAAPLSAPSASPESSPSPSSKSPSSSETPPTSPLNDLPRGPSTNNPPPNNGHTSSSQNLLFLVLCLVISTIFFYPSANPTH